MSNAIVSDSDPVVCQWKDRGSDTICGWEGKSLRAHLKRHKVGGKTLTLAQYQAKFPNADIGAPMYSPSPEHVAKFRAAGAGAAKEKTAESAVVAKTEATTDREERIAAKAEILWNLVERDPAAEMMCKLVATDEILLDEAYKRAEEARRLSKWESLQAINRDIDTTSKRFRENQDALGVNADQRRRNNQLGSDTLTQLVSNYENTLRKMAPARREAFMRKFETWQATAQARVRSQIIDKVEDQFDVDGTVVDEGGFRAAILDFGKRLLPT